MWKEASLRENSAARQPPSGANPFTQKFPYNYVSEKIRRRCSFAPVVTLPDPQKMRAKPATEANVYEQLSFLCEMTALL